jgi:hypothetical protein
VLDVNASTPDRVGTAPNAGHRQYNMMTHEQKQLRALFVKLTRAPLQLFPRPRRRLDAPDRQGVHVIYSPRGQVLHVGRTPKGIGGIRQRLNNHLHNASSFTTKYLKGDGAKLRRGCKFSCLVVKNTRHRALLEAYAIGRLCPAHIGDGSGLAAHD